MSVSLNPVQPKCCAALSPEFDVLDVDDDHELGTAGIGRGSLDPLAASSAR